ncbi:MAG: hypothetical protein JNL82_31085 [Myxococcales bacterium]|nr:hypothetical protein [Myxococcales bacterium]
MTTERDDTDTRRDWLTLLTQELCQTEQSAREHPIVEARRLGDVPPAWALRAVAEHATAAHAGLQRLTARPDRPDGVIGRTIGHAFSVLRDHFADVLLSSEKSYRATLLGMRHGVDLTELVRSLAATTGDDDLVAWCDAWLDRRRPLVEAAARELAWFAAHPAEATAPARHDSPIARGLHSLLSGCQHAIQRLRRTAALREQTPAAAQ